ncbi:MAG: hypothetical protein WBB01_06005 [Phormidesmis sp.]
MKDKDILPGVLSAIGSPYSINPAYATVSPLLGSFLTHRVSPTKTLLRGQLTGQFIAPSELFCNRSRQPYAAPVAVRPTDTVDTANTADTAKMPATAKTAAVNRLTRVLHSDRESVQTVGQPRLAAQKV